MHPIDDFSRVVGAAVSLALVGVLTHAASSGVVHARQATAGGVQSGAPVSADPKGLEADRHEARARELRTADSYSAALVEAERALALRESLAAGDPPSIARSLLLVAQLNDALARFGDAEALYRRARAVLGAPAHDELLAAEILDSYAANATARARFGDAEQLAREALAIRERALRAGHILVARSWATLADVHHENANPREAALAADRAFDIAAATLDPADASLADFIDRAARARLAAGQFEQAEKLYRKSLDIRSAGSAADSLTVAESTGGLARVALRANDNVRAEGLHLSALAVEERVFGPDHPRVAALVFNLALIQYRRRDYATALALNQRALQIWEKRLGEAHPKVATVFNNLGLVYWRQQDYERAEEFFQRALDVSQRLYGPDSLRVSAPLANLGIVAKERGNYDAAEARYKQALAIQENHLGPNHPDLIVNIESLAILYRDRGDYALAEEMFERTLSITESSLGPEHPFMARHLDNVAHLNWASGNRERAFAALQRFLSIEERNLPLNIATGSERQKLAYFEPRLRNLDEAISFHIQHPTDDGGVRDLALTTLLQRKGRILDALGDNLNAFRIRAQPEDQALLGELARVTSSLARTVLGDATSAAKAERQRLAADRERLEAELHRRSVGFLAPSAPVTLAAVKNALPPDAALVEFAVYRPFDPRSSVERGNQFGAHRYVAYVVRSSGEPGWKDLGSAAEIDTLVHRFRAVLADSARSDAARVALQLHQKVLAPVLPFVGDARHLLISPDGSLNLIPFEALRSPQGRYLVEDAAVSYVTAGRDLVRMLAPRPAASGMVVVANPAFGEPSAPAVTGSVASTTVAARPARRSITAGESLASVYFAPLAGTASEARRIQALFPDVELRLGARATEEALKSLRAPRILHVATHGFFLQDSESPESGAAGADTRALNATSTLRIENPLLRSGLALAGANLTRHSGDDGILTALEAANLNLWGTKLVTLSACDTGVGVVRNGEGVYGLRRAFFLAGAETLVMSLWPVSDLITRDMMLGYYAGLQRGLGRGDALRQMQLKMLKRKGREHPFYWAGFIQAGDWTPLDGRR